ncbi:MAG: STAS domain-containing protein [Anaerolineales bacterium]|jgi:anti-sigma B factor antagonist
MDIKDKIIKDVTIVSINGSIDALTAPEITNYMNDLIASEKIKLIADFSGVDYTSSAGLRVLLAAVKATRAKGGDLYLVGVQPDVLKVLSLSGFTSIIKIFSEIDQAVNSFS